MQETESIDEYILQHIDAESDYLKALYRDTHVKLLRPRMASGHLQGRMLKMFVEMIRPRHTAFQLSDMLSKGERGEAYRLTHDTKAVTFTLGESTADVSAILTKP